MKKFLLIIIGLCTVFTSYSQVETKFSFQSGKAVTKDYPRIATSGNIITLPAVDTEGLEDEDNLESEIDSPFRFGKGLDVYYSLESGQWVEANGGRIWNLSFAAKGALSLNFVFNKISIPDGAYMYITNMEENVIYGPVTNNEIVDGDDFLSDIIPGDNVTINLYEPIEHKGESVLIIKKIVLGYRSIYGSMLNGLNGSSAACNVDVACNPLYEKESKGIGLVLLASGEELCSGSLIMSADMTFKPYFLTAFHCIDIYRDGQLSASEISDSENWMFKFYHKKQECDGSILATSYTYNKAYLRSAWYNTDFALMEIKADVKQNTNLVWLGWDNTTSIPTSGAGIHHPAGDVMKISIEENQFQNTTPASVLGNNGWTVGFDSGIVEGGSSGSPILNQNKKIVGQLWGGITYPDAPCLQKTAYYGKLCKSWNGGGLSNTSLKSWLNPDNKYTFTEIESCYPYQLTIDGPSIICGNSSSYSVNGLHPNWHVEWSLDGYINAFVQKQDALPPFYGCTITKKNVTQQNAIGVLVAKIYEGNELITMAYKKIINMAYPLTAHFTQEACNCDGINHDALNSQLTLNNSSGLVVHQCCMASLKCSEFEFMNIYHSGITPSYFYFNGKNEIVFTMPSGSGGVPMHIFGTAKDNSGTCFNFHVVVFSTNGNVGTNAYSLSMQSIGSEYIFSITENKESIVDPDRISRIDKDKLSWKLDIYDFNTGENVHRSNVKGKDVQVNTYKWKGGVYMVRAVVGEEVYTQKIIVR